MSVVSKIQIVKVLRHASRRLSRRQPTMTSYQESPRHLVVMVRHGECVANTRPMFEGWADSPLTEKGRGQAQRAGQLLHDAGLHFDVVFHSRLQRTRQTWEGIAEELEHAPEEVIATAALNERHFGNLTGMLFSEADAMYGADFVNSLRHEPDVSPPPIETTNANYSRMFNTFRDLPPEEFPTGESIRALSKRANAAWRQLVVPKLKEGKRVMLVSHMYTLAAILQELFGFSNEAFHNYKIPNAFPFSFVLDSNMRPLAERKLQFYGEIEENEAVEKMFAGVG